MSILVRHVQTIRCNKTTISFELVGCYSHQHANAKDVAYFDDSTDFAGIRQKVKSFSFCYSDIWNYL